MLKDIYEALRNGPGWNKTLFVVTYDDYGGFYDHVERPAAGSPMKLVISRVCSTARAQQTHEGDTPMRSEGSIERVADERGTTSNARGILVWARRGALE